RSQVTDTTPYTTSGSTAAVAMKSTKRVVIRVIAERAARGEAASARDWRASPGRSGLLRRIAYPPRESTGPRPETPPPRRHGNAAEVRERGDGSTPRRRAVSLGGCRGCHRRHYIPNLATGRSCPSASATIER